AALVPPMRTMIGNGRPWSSFTQTGRQSSWSGRFCHSANLARAVSVRCRSSGPNSSAARGTFQTSAWVRRMISTEAVMPGRRRRRVAFVGRLDVGLVKHQGLDPGGDWPNLGHRTAESGALGECVDGEGRGHAGSDLADVVLVDLGQHLHLTQVAREGEQLGRG